jgi:chloramphenicol 3-O phosphotransferase
MLDDLRDGSLDADPRRSRRSSATSDYGRAITGGTLIFLNGASSSGKGTLARALQEALDAMFLHIEMDDMFGAMENAGYNGPVLLGQAVPTKLARGTAFIHDDWKFVRIEYGDEGRRVFQSFFAMIAALTQEGNNLIVDGFLTESWMIPSAAASLGALPAAYLVGLRCAEEELERRERERGDRFPGIARASARTVHKYVQFYDVEVDTGSRSVEECVRTILARVARGEPQAIKALEPADPARAFG